MREVEFDLDGDGYADTYALTRGDGTFEFVPIDVAVIDNMDGSFDATIQARVVGSASDSLGNREIEYQTYGAWKQFAWTIQPNETPEITNYELAYDTGNIGLPHEVLDRVTSDPTLLGRVTNDNGAAYLQVEFDHNGDGIIDGSAATDRNGDFRYEPVGLSIGRWNIRARVTEVDTRTGELLGAQNWRSLTGATGEDSFEGFTLVEAGSLSPPTLVAPTGSTKDPTLSGNVAIADSNENLVVEFYLNGSNESFGSTTVNRDGDFEFTPTGLDFATNHQITAKVKRRNYLTGEYDPSNASNSVTLNFESFDNFGVSQFVRESTNSLLDFTLTGTVANAPTDVSLQHVEIVQVGNESNVSVVQVEGFVSSGSSTVTQGFRFEPELQSTDTNVQFKARAVGIGPDGFVFGNWAFTTSMNYDTQAPSLTAEQEQDGNNAIIPTSRTIVGQVTLAPSYSGDTEVDFDFDGDGVVDDTIATETAAIGAVGSFSYELTDVEPGLVSIRARSAWYHEFTETGEEFSRTERIEGEWITIEFDLVSSAPSVTIELAEAVGPTTPEDLQTYEPRIVGSVTSPLETDVAGMTVEIDLNADGVADDTTTVYLDGTFEYTIDDLASESLPTAQQSVTLFVRAIDAYSDNEVLYGTWEKFEFELLRTDPPEITTLTLENDEDFDVNVQRSSNPILVGSTSTPLIGATQTRIEFRHDSDDELADGSAIVDSLGNFRYAPTNLPFGPTTINARTVTLIGNEVLVGPWFIVDPMLPTETGLTFYHNSADPAVINELEVLDTAVGSLYGRATVGGFGERITVEVQVVGSMDPAHNFTIRTERDGFFEFEVPKLSAGNSYVIEVRGLTDDPNAEGQVAGEWRPLASAFTHDPAAFQLSVINEFDLAFDTGVDQLDTKTNDATLKGTVDQWRPQLFVEFYDDTQAAVINTVAVLPDGTFRYTPTSLAEGSQTIRARTKQWDPHAGSYKYDQANWSNAAVESFILDAAENTLVSIATLNVWQNTATAGQTQQTNSPTFVGTISNDGNRAGLTIEFDHNDDGIVDGRAISKADGTFLYHAVGLEPSNATQSISATVIETDYLGHEFRSAPTSREYILTRAPLIKDLEHYLYINGGFGSVFGQVVSDVLPANLTVEYKLYGEGTQSSAPDINTIDLGTWEPGDIQSTTVNSSYGFGIDTVGLSAGPATLLVRATGDGVTGPWQPFHFVAGETSVAPHAIHNFQAPHVIQGTTQNVSDPLLTGSLDAPNTPDFVEGAYGIVEITVENQSDANALPLTFRTSADKHGDFEFSPTHLVEGQIYKATARSIRYNPAAGEELFGTPSETTFTLVSGTAATVVFTQLPTAGSNDPTIIGHVSDPDGRSAGLRVEIDYGNDGSVDQVVYTSADGSFAYQPYGLLSGTYNIRARVEEWNHTNDPGAGEPDWGVAQSFTLDDDVPEEPTLDQEIDNEINAANLAELGFKDAIFALLGELNVAGAQADMLDLGIGDIELLHKGGAGDTSAEQELTGAVFEPDSTFSTLNDTRQDSLQFTTSEGDQVDVDYDLARNVTLSGSTFTAQTTLHVTFDSYTDDAGELVFGAGADNATDTRSYTFEFTADGSLSGGQLIDANYNLRETVHLDFAQTETSDTGATRTTIGDYFFERLEGDDNGIEYTSTFDASGDVEQKFMQTEVVRLESWFDETGSETTSSATSSRSNSFTTEEHIIVESTTTVTNGLISANSGGLDEVTGTLEVELHVTADGIYGTGTSSSTDHEGGGSDSNSDNETVQSYYEGSFFVTTTDYADGELSEQVFDLQESTNVTVISSGSGWSSASGSQQSSNSSWSYGNTAIIHTSSITSGTFTERVFGNDTRTTIDATVTDGSLVMQDFSGSSGSFYANSNGDGTDEGSTSSSYSGTTSSGSGRSATIFGVDDQVSVKGETGVYFSSDITQFSSNTGKTITPDSEHYYISKSAVNSTGGGSAGSEFNDGSENNVTTSTANSSVNVRGSYGSQTVGKITDDDGETITRSNAAGVFYSGSAQGTTTTEISNGNGTPTRFVEGAVSRSSGSDGFSSTFYSSDDDFSLSFGTSKSFNGEGFDFTDSNGTTSQQGAYNTTQSSTGTSISKVTINEGDTTGSAFSLTTGESTSGLRGTFEAAGESTNSQGSATLGQMGTSFNASRLSTIVDEPGRTESTQTHSKREGFQSQSVEATVELIDGEVIEQHAIGSSNSGGESNSGYSVTLTTESQTDEGLERTASSSKGSSIGFSSSVSGSVAEGADTPTVETLFEGNQSGSVSNNSLFTSLTERSDGRSTEFVRSSSIGRLGSQTAGEQLDNGEGGIRTTTISSSTLGGRSFTIGRGSSTVQKDDVTVDTESSSLVKSRSQSSSVGTQKRSAEGDTSLSGQSSSRTGGEYESLVETTETYRSGSNVTVTVDSSGSSTQSTSGEVKRDQDRTREKGTFAVGNSSKQEVTVVQRSGGSGSSSYNRGTQTTTSVTGSDVSGTGSYEHNEDHTSGPAYTTNSGGGSSNSGSGSASTRSNNGSSSSTTDDIQVSSSDRNETSSKSSSRSSGTDTTSRSDRESKSHSNSRQDDDRAANDGGDTDVRVYVTKTFFPATGDTLTQTTTVTTGGGSNFTGGSEPGDQQSLTITSNRSVVYETETDYDQVQSAAGRPHDKWTVTRTESTGTFYNASHTLGSNGESVGGQLIAISLSGGSYTSELDGTSYDDGNGTEVELVKDKGSSSSFTFVIENGNYGTNQPYTGDATSTRYSSSSYKQEIRTKEDDGNGTTSDDTETINNSSWSNVTTKFNFNDNDSNKTPKFTSGSKDTTRDKGNGTNPINGDHSHNNSYETVSERQGNKIKDYDRHRLREDDGIPNLGTGEDGVEEAIVYTPGPNDGEALPEPEESHGGPANPGWFSVDAGINGSPVSSAPAGSFGELLDSLTGAAGGASSAIPDLGDSPSLGELPSPDVTQPPQVVSIEPIGGAIGDGAREFYGDNLLGNTLGFLGDLITSSSRTKKVTYSDGRVVYEIANPTSLELAGQLPLPGALAKKASKGFFRKTAVATVDDVASKAIPKVANDDAARAALRKALGQEGTGKVAHHLVPLEAQSKFSNLLEKARRGGFDINGANNGRLLDPANHVGNHPLYNRDVLRQLNTIPENLSDREAAKRLQNIADTLGDAIDNGTYGPWG